MTNNIYLNTLLKILTVFVIGYFVFDLLFGMVTGNFGMSGGAGGAGGAHGHHGASGGEPPSYTFDVLTNALLILLLKLMVVLFLIVLIAGATKWVKLIWTENGNQKQKLTRSNSMEVSSLLILTGSIFSLLLFFSILKGFNFGGMVNNMNTSMSPYPKSYNTDAILGGFINILLYITSVVLGIELFLHLKKYYMLK